jgi:hypothetical protein
MDGSKRIFSPFNFSKKLLQDLFLKDQCPRIRDNKSRLIASLFSNFLSFCCDIKFFWLKFSHKITSERETESEGGRKRERERKRQERGELHIYRMVENRTYTTYSPLWAVLDSDHRKLICKSDTILWFIGKFIDQDDKSDKYPQIWRK